MIAPDTDAAVEYVAEKLKLTYPLQRDLIKSIESVCTVNCGSCYETNPIKHMLMIGKGLVCSACAAKDHPALFAQHKLLGRSWRHHYLL